MTKSIADHVSAEVDGKPAEFAAWVITETGMTFRSKAARDAFERGCFVAVRGYHLYQEANREAASKRRRSR